MSQPADPGRDDRPGGVIRHSGHPPVTTTRFRPDRPAHRGAPPACGGGPAAVAEQCAPRRAHWHDTGASACDGAAVPVGQRVTTRALPADIPLTTLVRMAKLRWRVEHDYREMKQALGLAHFEGRTFTGWHHHVTLVSLARAFRALRRLATAPKDSGPV